MRSFLSGVCGVFLLMLCDFGLAVQAVGQGSQDSLIALLERADSDSARIELNIQIGLKWRGSAPRQALTYFEQALKLAEHSADTLSMANALYQKGIAYDFLSDSKSAKVEMQKALEYYRLSGSYDGETNALNSLGVIDLRYGAYDSALEYYLQATARARAVKDTARMVTFICNSGHVFFYQENAEKCLEYYYEALELAKQAGDPDLEAECRQHIGLVLHITGRIEEADEQYSLALQAFRRQGSVKSMERANLFQNMAVMMKDVGKLEQSEAYYDSSLSIYTQLGNQEGLAQTYVNLASLNILRKNYKESEVLLDRAYGVSKGINSKEGFKYVAQIRSELFEAQGDPVKALEYFKEFKAYSDSLRDEKSQARIDELETMYDSDRKAREIETLLARQETLDAELARQSAEKRQYQLIFGSAFLALSLAATFFFFRVKTFRLQREKKRQRIFSEKLIRWQEKERQRIAGELHDGIGQSLIMLKNRVLKMKNDQAAQSNAHELDLLAGNITGTIQEVRGISYALRPFQLELLGLRRSLEEMLEDVSKSSQLQLNMSIDDVSGCLTPDEEIHVYRIVQECVNNMLKHSRAKKASVHLAMGDHFLNIRIADDGIGFDPTESFNSPEGFGLKGVKERVKLLQGNFKVESEVGKGCRIFIKVPAKGKSNEFR